MPRRYRMRKRADAVQDTRRRILEATMALHAEQGIQATTWEDIAARAGVAVATVYRHFASVDELVPACGALTDEVLRPPTAADADALLAGVEGVEARLARVLQALCDFYDRGGEVLLGAWGERHAIPALATWLAGKDADRGDLVRAALAPAGAGPGLVRAATALSSVLVWHALAEAGVSSAERPGAMLAAVLGNRERMNGVLRSSGTPSRRPGRGPRR